MRLFHEFKEFASRGNVIDLAVGVIVGAAFGRIVTSLVNDVIMPPFGALMGKVDVKDQFINLAGKEYDTLAAAKAAGAATLNYGAFLNTIIEFLIVSFAVFMLVRQINKLRSLRKRPDGEPSQKECRFCFSSIPYRAIRCPHCTSELSKK